MNYIIISGSHRQESQSEKVSHWLKIQLVKRGEVAEVISLGGNPFPLWDESVWKRDSELVTQMKSVLGQVSAADALIIVAPEWAGMAPGGLKNFLLYLSSKHLGHKPVLLVGVSSSHGGAYPIAELRSFAFKNNKACVIPEHLIIRDVEDIMNDDNETGQGETDAYIRRRVLFALDVLAQYAVALKPVRESDKVWDEEYPYGM